MYSTAVSQAEAVSESYRKKNEFALCLGREDSMFLNNFFVPKSLFYSVVSDIVINAFWL